MEKEQFQGLVDTWYKPLYLFALSLTRNPDDAQDLTQQTFARWAEKGHQLKKQESAKSWLFMVLYREFVGTWRRRGRFSAEPVDEFLHVVADDRASPPVPGDAQAAIDALAAMEERFRVPLTLFYLEELSYREIAEVLDLPIGTVMSRLARGRERLRVVLENPVRESGKIIQLPTNSDLRHGQQ